MQQDYRWQEIEELAGSHYDMGRQHGRNNSGHMRYLVKAFGLDLTAPWSETDFLDPLQQHLPELVEEIQGIAEGGGLSLREVCALSFLVDLNTAVSACTGVVFASGPDGPVIGKTSDCTPGVQQSWLRPRRVKPSHGLEALIYSHIGSPNAEMGMNKKGLAIGISGLLSRNVDPQGVGWQQDIRGVLHACATTAEAIAMLRAIPIRRAGYALVIGDSSGDVAVIEKVVGKVAVRRPVNNIIYEANIALSEEALPYVDPSWCGENSERRTALLELLSREWSDFSLQGMIDLFSTHRQPVGICQHGPELHSHLGFFMLPAKREAWVARGYTCERNLQVERF